MAANGSPRRRTPARRALVGLARIAALLAIIIGGGGLLVPSLAYRPAFYAVAVLFAVTSFVLLRTPQQTVFPPTPVLLHAPPPEPLVVVDEARVTAAREEERERWESEVSRSQDAIRRTKQELEASEQARHALTRNVEEMTETILAQRGQIATQNASTAQQLVRADGLIAELNTELTSARQSVEELRLQHARDIEKMQKALAQREAEITERFRKAFESRETEHQRDVSQRVTRLNELQRALENERGIREQVATLARELQQQITAGAAAQGELHAATDRERAARVAAEARAGELQQAIEAERAARERIDAQAQDLAKRVAGLEEVLGREREAAAAETQNLSAKLATALDQHAAAVAQAEEIEARLAAREKEWDENLQKIVAGLAEDHEEDIGKATMEREAAHAETRHLQIRLQELERQIEEQHAAREKEWDDKLQKIVNGMAVDHEEDVGKATLEREEARAEVRRLTARVRDLEREIEEQRQTIEAEWSAKLETIVAHLASDHEADVGKAFEEKEEAKAEVRNLSMKVSALQQQIERDRQIFLTAEEKWNSVRESLIAKAEAATREQNPFPAVHVPTPDPFGSPFAASVDPQRARAEVLEFAEQAHAVLKRTSIPGTIPVPRTDGRARILFVHHDPAMRTMWRDQLHRHGYEVITAADGLEGLRLATAQKPAVVIADAQMPKMDGRELCRLIKSNDATASTKVVLLSAAQEPVPNEGFAPDELLAKPVKFEALQTALANLLTVH